MTHDIPEVHLAVFNYIWGTSTGQYATLLQCSVQLTRRYVSLILSTMVMFEQKMLFGRQIWMLQIGELSTIISGFSWDFPSLSTGDDAPFGSQIQWIVTNVYHNEISTLVCMPVRSTQAANTIAIWFQKATMSTLNENIVLYNNNVAISHH